LQGLDRRLAGRGEAASRRLPLGKLLSRQLVDPASDLVCDPTEARVSALRAVAGGARGYYAVLR
jgi:hypothetical protein